MSKLSTTNFAGYRFGRLVALVKDYRTRKWLCVCDCGSFSTVSIYKLWDGLTKSCGCLNRDNSSVRKTTHGLSKSSRAYHTWYGMRQRCQNKNSPKYPRYGGRGITVCERWEAFENFLQDMGEPPKGTSLDRVNNDGNYEPSNCRWATPTQQVLNTSRNRVYEFQGKKQTISQWSEELGVSQFTIHSRIKLGWSIGDVLTRPVMAAKRNSKAMTGGSFG